MSIRWESLVLLVLPIVALGSDGQLEINQACAETGGCFAGDGSGFPVTISAPGSYILTSNLQVSNENTTAIDLTDDADGTTIDLNGFRIQGVTSCSPINDTCVPTGTGVGINASSGTVEVRVVNGTVSGMGSHGILLQNRDLVKDVVAINNGGVGIEVGPRSSVIDCQAILNGGSGIVIDENTSSGQFGNAGESLLSGNLATQNSITDQAGLDIEGSRSGGGNVCGDNSCSLRDARRFYLTAEDHTGATAATACTRGYHMASLWEILDVSNLQYAAIPQRGVGSAIPTDDQGSGPPRRAGWVRTGGVAENAGSSNLGLINCDAFTVAVGEGTTVTLLEAWNDAPTAIGPWEPRVAECAGTRFVWCVED